MFRQRSASRAFFIGVLAASCLSLAACGFHLRGTGPAIAQDLYLEGLPPHDSFMGTFGSTMSMAGGKLASNADKAGGIIHIYKASHFKRYLALSRAGRSVEYDLSYRVVYDVRTSKGEVLLPRQEIETKRDYFNDQTLPLGQAEEEGLIRQELEREAAQTLLRRAVFALTRASEKKKT
jgi:LPS-assembly lipoprotein